MTTQITSAGVKTMQASATKTATYHGSGLLVGLQEFTDLVVSLDVTAMDIPDTYDFYITTGDGVSEWDLAHIQIVNTTTVPARYSIPISGKTRPTNTTTATPGVEAVTSAVLNTITAGSDHGYGTLTSGIVRHGPWGDRLGYYLVCANASASITYSITITLKR